MLKKKEGFKFWNKSLSDNYSYLGTSEKGLSNNEANSRIIKYGHNEIQNKNKRVTFNIFIDQFKNPLILVLIVASVIAYALGEKIDAVVIIAIVIINALLGFFQEYKAEKTVHDLESYIKVKTKVLRNNELTEIESKHLVPGDIVYLSIGDFVPADVRLIHTEDLSANESSLTGESLPVSKYIKEINQNSYSPQNINNMLFMGTYIASGSCYGIIASTGKDTFFGKMSISIQQKVPDADFQKNIKRFSNMLLKVIILMVIFIFIINTVFGKDIIQSLLFALALAVGITPEVLPVVITIALSKGALKMSKKKVIIKKLEAVEDFGNMDTLCCDKTGTLTEGFLKLEACYNYLGKTDTSVLILGVVSSLEEIHEAKNVVHNPLDKSIHNSDVAKSIKSEVKKYMFLDENPLDFERRRSSVYVKKNNQNILIVKGAPESVIGVCSYIKQDSRSIKLTSSIKEKLKSQYSSYELSGFKVIAIATKLMKANHSTKYDENALTLQGFMTFSDPPKKGIIKSLKDFENLGIDIKIITGDSPIITKKICKDIGIKIFEDRIITGDELENITELELETMVQKYNIFARVNPIQKYKIISSLNKEGHIVGYLGDGINDAAALKAADIGISVDTASGIAKDSADVILLKKGLDVISEGIIEGRKTFGNITKYILNTISANYGNMITVALSSLFLPFLPMLPAQILLLNFMSDMPSLTISTDNIDNSYLKKPKRWNISTIQKFMIYFGIISTVFDILTIVSFIYIFNVPQDTFRTAWFIESALTEIFVLFIIRTHGTFYKSRPSKALVISSMLTIFATILITYLAIGAQLFNFVTLSWQMILVIITIVLLYCITVEISKKRFFKGVDI